MATIVESIVGDRALRLGREEFVRKFSFGSDWKQLRLMIWFSIPGAASITNAMLTLGVCQGSSGYRSADVGKNALTATCPSAFRTWTYAAGPPPTFAAGGVIGVVQSVSGGTNVLSTAGSGICASANAAAPLLFGVDFYRRGSTVFYEVEGRATTGAAIYGGTATPFERYRSADWQQTFSIGSYVHPYSESLGIYWPSVTAAGSGLWDSVCLSWSHNSPAIEINNLIVTRFVA